jgi:hypothetical protein
MRDGSTSVVLPEGLRLGPTALGRLFERSGDWARLKEKQGRIPAAHRDHAGRRFWTLDQLPEIRAAVAGHGA